MTESDGHRSKCLDEAFRILLAMLRPLRDPPPDPAFGPGEALGRFSDWVMWSAAAILVVTTLLGVAGVAL